MSNRLIPAVRLVPAPDEDTSNRDQNAPTAPESDTKKTLDEKHFRSRTERVVIRGRVPIEKAKNYRVFCCVRDMPMQTALEEAMDDLLEKYGFPFGAQALQRSTDHDPDDLFDHDDKEVANSSSSDHSSAPVLSVNDKQIEVLGFYQECTGNRVKESDLAAYRLIADLPTHVIRAGIIYAVWRCPTKVHSLKYCIPVIDEVFASGISKEIVNYLEAKFSDSVNNRGPRT